MPAPQHGQKVRALLLAVPMPSRTVGRAPGGGGRHHVAVSSCSDLSDWTPAARPIPRPADRKQISGLGRACSIAIATFIASVPSLGLADRVQVRGGAKTSDRVVNTDVTTVGASQITK
jgi:hypothetical protein